MTNETRERIRAYKKLLPDMRERVLGVALLLITSVAMMVTASFAWITLSRAPEVTGMQTTVAANGNLEIALAQGSITNPLTEPGASKLGDSSAAENQTIVGANTTWGNLVNVSDPVYGLSNIALRPALLSDFNRKDTPLSGAIYGEDGRVVKTNEAYGFASYVYDETSGKYYFAAGEKNNVSLVNYGVRSINSVVYKQMGDQRPAKYLEATNNLYQTAQNYYGKIVSNEKNSVNTLDEQGTTCISALEGLVAVFAQDKINEMGFGPSGTNKDTQTSCSPYLWYVYQMLLRLETVFNDEGIALLKLANWEAYVRSGDDKVEDTFGSVTDLLDRYETWTGVQTDDKGNRLGLTGATKKVIKSYATDLDDLKDCIGGIKPMAENCQDPKNPQQEYFWSDIADYVNVLVDINTATLAGKKLSDINGVSDAMAILGGGDVIVYGGLLKNVESRLINQTNRLKASVTVKVKTNVPFFYNASVDGVVYTDVGKKQETPTYSSAIEAASSLVSTLRGEATAKDTYGMALDVWVRTNYPGAILTLEGSVKYEDVQEIKTINGTEYGVYILSVDTEEVQVTADVYEKDGKWYYVSDPEIEVPEDKITNQTPEKKMIQKIVGYEGENRIWEDWRDLLEEGYIVQDATTQGAGSCFVFYASTPTEQAKIMELLESFRVAFMDQDGEILGTARLNLKSAYANQGKVTVPLEVDSGETYVDATGEERTGITRLVQNKAKFISAIVYLDGSDLKNANVLANGEIQGQLNIQFGTDSVLIAPDNEELMNEARSITAEVTANGTTISNGTIGGTEGLEYKAEGYDAVVKLTVEGEQPERISGFFVRVINSTQGTRGETKNFTKQADGTWVATFKLTNPGTYAFNTLIVDGVQYTLHDGSEKSGINSYYKSNRPYVHIKGLKIGKVTVGVDPGTYMTADTSMSFPVEVKVDAAVKPKQVNAQFFNKDNSRQFTAILTYDEPNEMWVGAANISASDTYTLKYISVDGDILDAPATGTYTLYLGLTAHVYTRYTGDREFPYIGNCQIDKMFVEIYDDSYSLIENLEGVKLYYNNVLSPASMTWNGVAYEGVFDIVQPGLLTFQKLELGTVGTVRKANSDAPVFLAYSMLTPSYGSSLAQSSQIAIPEVEDPAKITVTIPNGGTARKVYAEIQGPKGMLYIETDTEEGETREFTLPREDGNYTLKRVFLQGVYDNNWVNENGETEGKWYPDTQEVPTSENEDTFFILTATDECTTEVIAEYVITVRYGDEEKTTSWTETFNSTTTDTPFMTTHTSKELSVEITDKKGREIVGVSKVTWVIDHEGKMQEYGGYTGPEPINNPITLSKAEGSKTKYVASGQSFAVAGEYSSSITVHYGEKQLASLGNVPTFAVRSKTPTVVITDITLDNNGAYSIDKNTTGSLADTSTYTTQSSGCVTDYTYTCTTHKDHVFVANNTQYISKIVDANGNKAERGLTAYLYFKCNHEDVETYSGGTKNGNTGADFKGHTYSYNNGDGVPRATITLSGMGNATSAVLEFAKTGGGDVVMITQYTADRSGGTYWGDFASYGTSSFGWKADGACSRFIGVMDNGAGSNRSDTKTTAGTISSDTLVLTYNSKEYSFQVPTITIHNPY